MSYLQYQEIIGTLSEPVADIPGDSLVVDMTRDELNRLYIPKLKEMLRERGPYVSGNKSELIEVF
jgi:hypothetical protein